MKKITIDTKLESISKAVKDVEDLLKSYKVKSEDCVRAILSLEETLVKVAEAAGENGHITICILKGLKGIKVRVSCKGSQTSIDNGLTMSEENMLEEAYGPEAEGMIRDIVLRANSERMRYNYSKGVNIIDIIVTRNDKLLLYQTLAAMLIGCIIGILVRFLFPGDVATTISNDLFMPLYSIFLTSIKMIVAPLVFFSIAASVSGFTDLSTLERTGGKVIGCYLLTTIIAIGIAVCACYIVQPGLHTNVELPINGLHATDINVSLKDTIIGIIPDNFLGAFVKSDMLQIIFLALLVGTCTGTIGKHAQAVRTFIEATNDLFCKITSVLARLLPLAAFGSSANMAITLDMSTFSLVMAWCLQTLACYVVMYFIYLTLIATLGHANPLVFARKYFPASLTAFMTSSSNATMPTSMKMCQELGISPRIYNFSIPLGASINMDGSSIYLITTVFFLGRLIGLEFDSAALLTLIPLTILLSVASPGAPGAGIACELMLLSVMGIPTEALTIVFGIHPLVELFCTSINVTGDGTVTTIVAKTENAIDMDVYNE